MLLFWMIDITVGLLPGNQISEQELRSRIANTLTIQVAQLLESEQLETLAKTLDAVERLNESIISIVVSTPEGKILAQSKGARYRSAKAPAKASEVSVPIARGQEKVATVRISFSSRNGVATPYAWLTPKLITPTLILIFGSLFFYLYLRRVLQHLDPSKVIPGRVSSALDTLTEGVMIMDLNGRLMLVNDAFKRLHPEAAGQVIGEKVEKIRWLQAEDEQPWEKILGKQAIQSRRTFEYRIPREDREDICKVIINASAVTDDEGRLRGCLVTFQDITEQEKTNAQLRKTLAELYRTQKQIEEKNRELTLLASYDQLTGLLNRRAFFERGEAIFKEHKRTLTPLVCIMCDIDHFKRINDGYGHAVGDEAIKLVAKFLRDTVRPGDIVGRYGGEEFCIILPNVDEVGGLRIAERIRTKIERLAGQGVRSVSGLKITCSFGLAPLDHSCETLGSLIDEADQALYKSKENGRNQVTVYDEARTVLL